MTARPFGSGKGNVHRAESFFGGGSEFGLGQASFGLLLLQPVILPDAGI